MECLRRFSIILAYAIFSWGEVHPQRNGSRIVGGIAINIQAAPYHALVQLCRDPICSGAIVSNQFVITAAHCVAGLPVNRLKVEVGITNLCEGIGSQHRIRQAIIHPAYNRKSFDYDIALLRLENAIAVDNRTKQAISLPLNGEALTGDTAVVVTGWGDTKNSNEPSEILRAVILKVVNRNQCNQKYSALGGTTDRMFCAGAEGRDACVGDGGGPVRRLSDGKLVGLVSFGFENVCGHIDFPGVYTKVASVRNWIQANAGV